MARNNRVRIDRIMIEAGEDDLTGHGGLMALVQWLWRKGVRELLDARPPQSAADNGYRASDMVVALWANILVYGSEATLDTLDALRKNLAVLRILGMESLPSSSAVGDWLRRMGNVELQGTKAEGQYGGHADGVRRMQDVHYEVAALALRGFGSELPGMLDFDASCIEEEKKYSEWMYTGDRGTMAYLGYVGRVCVMVELEPGNHSPNDHVVRRTISCMRLCARAGVKVKATRADAASYTKGFVKYCQKRRVTFYVRAPQGAAVKETLGAQPADAWHLKGVRQAGSGTPRVVELGRAAHAMDGVTDPFLLVARRETTVTAAPEGDLVPDTPVVERVYFAVGTNDVESTDEQIVEIYNARGNSENRHKEIKADLHLDRLPCGGERGRDANRIYAYACGMLYNLLELYKRDCMGKEAQAKRLPTLRKEQFAVAAKVTRHARVLTLKLASYATATAQWLDAAVTAIRSTVKPFAFPKVAPAYGAFMYRRL